MELILGYEILESYKRLPYKAWFAFAEFIDNSTQSYRNHKSVMDDWFEAEQDMLTVKISYNNRKPGDFIRVEDNAFGMDRDDLQNAMTLGKKPAIANERSKYGLGLKTAGFWFGNKWTIETTQKGSDELLTITVDLEAILNEETAYYAKFKQEHPGEPLKQFRPSLNINSSTCDIDLHGTTLIINDLVRTINAQTFNNCVEYLQSIYRVDLQNDDLYLEFQDVPLVWSQDDIDRKLLADGQGNPYKKDFDFVINGKRVHGWGGILQSGGKKNGGFSLIQADRVIVGYPKSYKNSLIFGDEDGGRNDLTNQRLTGEIYLDEKFAVSHTKDQILFVDDEEDELNTALFEKFADYKKEANIPHKARGIKEPDKDFDFDSAVKTVLNNLNSTAFRDVLLNDVVLPAEAIIKTNEETITRILKANHSEYKYILDGISIMVILSDQSSPYDPYLIVKPQGGENRINILLNVNHSYWQELEDNNSRFNFVLSCIYDGVAEWKAEFRLNRLDPNTIKLIKDSLLRLPLLNS